MDGDNDMDVVAAAYNADAVSWFENDGNENFTEHVITDSFDGSWTAFPLTWALR